VQAAWPVSAFTRSYVVVGGAPVATFLAAWIFYANFASSGDPHPLFYVPVLNPLDLAIAAAFIVLVMWVRTAAANGLHPTLHKARVALYAGSAAAAFIWLNGMLLRTLHHWAGLPFALEPMLSSRLVQAAFSILWMVLALALMVAGTRRAFRAIWIIGAALMGVVVAKLFLVDLSAVGTVERIVSFLAVGLLMLLIGYLSPVPPREPRPA
jgi:uncharacterized membrane protein